VSDDFCAAGVQEWADGLDEIGDLIGPRFAEARERMDKSRIEMIRGYAETDGCRRQFLLGYFGEDLPDPCGNCDNCTDGSADPSPLEENDGGAGAGAGDAEPVPLNLRVQHSEWGPGLVMRHDDDILTVLFDQEDYKPLSRKAVLERGLLARSRD
jgi:ATP-dependent DNA helicase RecQ